MYLGEEWIKCIMWYLEEFKFVVNLIFMEKYGID